MIRSTSLFASLLFVSVCTGARGDEIPVPRDLEPWREWVLDGKEAIEQFQSCYHDRLCRHLESLKWR